MTIPNCSIENVLNAEPRRGSTFFIPTLRRVLARRMWGLYLYCVPEYFLRGYAKSRRCSRARTFDFVAAVEHLRRSGSILHRTPRYKALSRFLTWGLRKWNVYDVLRT